MCLRKDSLCYFNTCIFPMFIFHVLTLSPKDGRAAALYGIDPYGMSFESTALYIGITSLPEYFAEPFVLLLETADFCRRHKERAPGKFFTC